MTVETLRADIDWDHVRNSQMLHWVRVLVDYVPELNSGICGYLNVVPFGE